MRILAIVHVTIIETSSDMVTKGNTGLSRVYTSFFVTWVFGQSNLVQILQGLYNGCELNDGFRFVVHVFMYRGLFHYP